jgi:hypothetical protein
MWDFETPIGGDSLQGWWPVRGRTYSVGTTVPDYQRPGWALDYGNNANYVINQAANHQRTFGVVGVWHRDNGENGGTSDFPRPSWGPLSGAYSAWMGLRVHADTAFADPVTLNPFNQDVLQFNHNGATPVSSTGDDKIFPGYGSQMDQMLYRDFLVDTLQDVTIEFEYLTRLNDGYGTSASTRTGWFDKDPLKNPAGPTNQAPGNFISSTDAGTNAPRDSFMVYAGAPVDSEFVGSDGVSRRVYDPLRRWFSEVLRVNEQISSGMQAMYVELLSVADTVPATAKSVLIRAAKVRRLAAGGGRLRLVFRVKTNRGYDDEYHLSGESGSSGAAVVDDVTYRIGTGATVMLGDFENAGAINNADGSPLASWKSTGKPPGLLFHPHDLASLSYHDVCGSPGAPGRTCDLLGEVLSAGLHDQAEAAGGPAPGPESERMDMVVSPTIQLCGPYPNPIGLSSAAAADATDDYYLSFDVYSEIFDPYRTGNYFNIGVQCYPARTANPEDLSSWGQWCFTPWALMDNADGECYDFLNSFGIGLRYAGLMRWDETRSQSPYHPDSIRIVLCKFQTCLRYGLTTACSPTAGGYFDNVSLAIVDQTAAPAAASVDIWNWFQDTFPTSGAPFDTPAALDTMGALIKTGQNLAPLTDNGLGRFDVPGDTSLVSVRLPTERVDLVFRILPGPGNYRVVGYPGLPASGNDLRGNIPSDTTALNQSDMHQFWAAYMADNGAFGTSGNGTSGPGHPGSPGARRWDPNIWNSARCDTAEVNVFPWVKCGIYGYGRPNIYSYMSAYHEADPKFATLGLSKHVCFLVDTTGVNCVALNCSSVPGWVTALAPGDGYDVSTGGMTKEYTKIIPDGLLTPGAHVEYFYRIQTPSGVTLVPDTNVVYPQALEMNFDGHRWQDFSVLPDRWKDPAYQHPVTGQYGLGAACMLVVDLNDRRGNERVWVSIADSIGATHPSRFGAHNGWHARGDQDVNDPSGFVPAHLGQAGTTWDFYQVKAAESKSTSAGDLGSRYAAQPDSVANPVMFAKRSRQGPTHQMLNLYKAVLLLSGDLNEGILGPYAQHSQDDVGVLENWLQSGSPTQPDRALWVMGDGFAQDCVNQGGVQLDFLNNYLGAGLTDPFYREYSGNQSMCVDLEPAAGFPPTTVFGVADNCRWSNDVLSRAGLGEAVDAHYYHGSAGGPLLAGVFKPRTAERPWTSLLDGFDVYHLTSRNGTDALGRIAYFYDVFTTKFDSVCTIVGTPLIPAGVENTKPGLTDYLRLGPNPARRGEVTLVLGLSRDQEVEAKLYDIGGRLVRTLLRRRMTAGEHLVRWDGRDEGGNLVRVGVYFTRVEYRGDGYVSARKLVVLR